MMEEFWNEFELKEPPLLTIQINGSLFSERLQSVLTKFLEQQSNAVQEEFAQAAALLSRLMARRKNSFRKLMVFKYICKLNSALCRLLRVDFPRVVENFSSTLPETFGDIANVSVPSRNNFDFVLIRLMGVYKIHQRIAECCREAATYIASMLRTNFFIEINTLLLAVIAKIRNISKILAADCSKLYSQILPYRNQFPKNKKYLFLPHNFLFPPELNGSEPKNEIKPLVAKVEAEEFRSLTNLTKSSTIGVPKRKKKMDMGMIVSRNACDVQNELNIEQLQTVEAIREFVSAENKARAISIKNCRTKSILKHEWQGAVKLFEKKLQANENKKAVTIFNKFLRSKI